MGRLYGKGQQAVHARVGEAYSPVRVTGMADNIGLIPGLAMDLTTCDEHGNPWDFNVESMRSKAKHIVKHKSALLLVVSPMCSAFSRLQSFNAKRLGPDNMREMIDYGIKHLAFALDLCEIQRRNGLYFLLEHPAGASSWTTSPMQRMLKRDGVQTYEGDMCCYDLRQVVGGEEFFYKEAYEVPNQQPLHW